MQRYIPPGMPAELEPAPIGSYIPPHEASPQPPAAQPPPDPPPEPHHTAANEPLQPVLAEWRRCHGDAWVSVSTLDPAVARLIDDRERLPVIRQKLRLLAGLEVMVVGNRAKPTRLYRLVEG